MKNSLNTISKSISKPIGMTIKALITAKILLTLNSCSTVKYVEKENSLDPNLTTLDSNSIRKEEEEKAADAGWKLFVERVQSMQDSIAQKISVSEWSWKIKVPGGGISMEFTVYDPDGETFFYCYDCPDECDEEGTRTPKGDHMINISTPPKKEGVYNLFIKAVCTEPEGSPTLLATYDYHKPEILTQINIQNGELSINQNIQGPVRIVLMNLTNNTSQEVVLNQNFKQGETLNAFQYFNMSQLNGKNCCLIVQDGSGQTVFDEKFYKI